MVTRLLGLTSRESSVMEMRMSKSSNRVLGSPTFEWLSYISVLKKSEPCYVIENEIRLFNAFDSYTSLCD